MISTASKSNCLNDDFLVVTTKQFISTTAIEKNMKSQLCVSDEEHDDESTKINNCCWWRSSTKYEDSALIKNDSNIRSLTPRLRIVRELERLALISHEGGLCEVRHKLQMYNAGDFWIPTGGTKKEEMDIPPATTILLVGFSGSGKSSLINLMYSVLGRSGLVTFAQTATGIACNYKTIYMDEHNVMRSKQSGFCVYDSRGFDYDKIGEALEEVSNWMSNGVHHNQLCLRPSSGRNGLLKDDEETSGWLWSSKYIQRRVNYVMVVVDIAKVYKALKAGDPKPLDATKKLFCSASLKKCNENPMLILTHGDLLTTEERIEARLKICETLGVSETNGVYDIVCLTEYGFLAEESDPVTAYALAESVYRALLISDRGHCRKRKFWDWIILILSWVLCALGAIFYFLAHVFSELGHGRKLKNL